MWTFVLALIFFTIGGEIVQGAINTCYRDNHAWIYDKYCLEIVLPQKNWYDARKYCASRGGDLVEVRTPQMQNSIASHLKIYNGGYKGFWIGATDTETEGWWRWSHNPRGMSWSNWSPQEGPNEHGFIFGGYTDDCAIIKVDHNYKWFDTPCDGVIGPLHYSSICQYVMATTTATTLTTTTTTTTKPTTTTPKPTTTTPKPTTTTAQPTSTTPKPTTTTTQPSTTTQKPTTTTPKPTTTTPKPTTTTPKPTTTTPKPTTTTPKPTTTTPKPTTTTPKQTTTTIKPTTTTEPTTTSPKPTTTTPKPSTTSYVEPTEVTVTVFPTECSEPLGCGSEPTVVTEPTTAESVGVIIG